MILMEKSFSGGPFRREVSPEYSCTAGVHPLCKNITTSCIGHAPKGHPCAHAPDAVITSAPVKYAVQVITRGARTDFSPSPTRLCWQQQSSGSEPHAMHPQRWVSICCFRGSLYNQERPRLFQSTAVRLLNSLLETPQNSKKAPSHAMVPLFMIYIAHMQSAGPNAGCSPPTRLLSPLPAAS